MLSRITVLAATVLTATATAAPAPAPPAPPAETVRATPAGGFTLGHLRLGISIELGYPFVDFRVAYGLGSRFQVLAGYRGLYSATNAPYAGIKASLFSNPARTVGVAVTALGGYSHTRDHDAYWTGLAGGAGGFGEVSMAVTARKRRHGVLIAAGLRLAQVTQCSPDCEDIGDSSVMATAFAEVGYEHRFMPNMSLVIAAGVDFFATSDWIPALPRFRMGMLADF